MALPPAATETTGNEKPPGLKPADWGFVFTRREAAGDAALVILAGRFAGRGSSVIVHRRLRRRPAWIAAITVRCSARDCSRPSFERQGMRAG